MIYHW